LKPVLPFGGHYFYAAVQAKELLAFKFWANSGWQILKVDVVF
jgi:hypothetical protein